MNWHDDHLPQIVRALAGRAGHEAARSHIADILRNAVDIGYDAIAHEVYLADLTGRIDTLCGGVVFEFKRNLDRDLAQVEARMPDYLREAARRLGADAAPTGIATDGARFIAFNLQAGALPRVSDYRVSADRPRAGRLTVPVYIGDAMQWNLRQHLGDADVVVDVPGEAPLHLACACQMT